MSSSSESESDVENTPDIADTTEQDEDTRDSSDKTFASLGLVDVLCEACEKVGWKKPSRIQAEAIPVALKGNDVIGLAETGSGKTGSFVLPILQALLDFRSDQSSLDCLPDMVDSAMAGYEIFMYQVGLAGIIMN